MNNSVFTVFFATRIYTHITMVLVLCTSLSVRLANITRSTGFLYETTRQMFQLTTYALLEQIASAYFRESMV